jgi:hypothetical protein
MANKSSNKSLKRSNNDSIHNEKQIQSKNQEKTGKEAWLQYEDDPIEETTAKRAAPDFDR